MPFFAPLFADKTIWPVVHHGFWLLVIASSVAAFSRKILPIILFATTMTALALFYPIGTISKNLIVAAGFVVCASALACHAGPFKVLQLVAVVTAINACICLVDILFVHSLSNTLGRAAGLSINPNIAALGLLLGATASYWTLPRRWLGHFLALIGAAVFVTLSKSVLIAYLAIFGAVLAVHIQLRKPLPRLAGTAVFIVGLVAWIALALTVNDRFVVATSNAFHVLGGALSAFKTARASIAAAAGPVSGASADERARSGASADEIVIEELSRRAENEGDINSVSARGLLMERAWIAYRNNPLTGIGLDKAFALAPRNSFLLFALAFGFVGWIIPLGFIALIRGNIPLMLATFAAAMVSHDVFLQPALLCPLAVAMAKEP
jgi:hypothetical protein